MVEAKLKILYPDAVITTVDEPENYSFAVKTMTSETLGYQLIFTDGLSKIEQPVKKGFEKFTQIELYFCLPKYFKLATISWPIAFLSKIAAVPLKNNTWFGPGDTLPTDNPPYLLPGNFPANHFMLTEPIQLSGILDAAVFTDENISFLGIIPICQAELDYKLRNSATVLNLRLQKKKYSEVVDSFRQPVCKKRFLGIF